MDDDSVWLLVKRIEMGMMSAQATTTAIRRIAPTRTGTGHLVCNKARSGKVSEKAPTMKKKKEKPSAQDRVRQCEVT